MSLSQSLRLAQERLDSASGAINTQMEFVRSELTEEENIAEDMTDELVKAMLKAERTITNTETQFRNYQEDLKEAIEGDKPLRHIPEEYHLQPTAEEYRKTYESAKNAVGRYEILERKFSALSQVMEQNGLGSPRERRMKDHEWYDENEYDTGFQTAAEI